MNAWFFAYFTTISASTNYILGGGKPGTSGAKGLATAVANLDNVIDIGEEDQEEDLVVTPNKDDSHVKIDGVWLIS